MDPFLGEIKIVGFDFAPQGWAACDGQILQIVQNQALYALLGITYGGNGSTTFGLPDLRGRVPLHFSSVIPMGGSGGEASHALAAAEMPLHTHAVHASDAFPDASLPTGNIWPNVTKGYADSPDTAMKSSVLGATGGQSHENCQPYLVVNFVISLVGIFPSRT